MEVLGSECDLGAWYEIPRESIKMLCSKVIIFEILKVAGKPSSTVEASWNISLQIL